VVSNIIDAEVVVLGPSTRINLFSSSSPIRLTARRKIYTIIKMMVIAVAMCTWIGLALSSSHSLSVKPV
jgi:hypothetical protein